MDPDFTHLSSEGSPGMVDVSHKAVTERRALACGELWLGEALLSEMEERGWAHKKGPILDTAILAGTMAAKKTWDLIPLCHPLFLSSCKIRIEPDSASACLRIEAAVKTTAPTGVEMEALTAVSVTALTLYDMIKAFSQELEIRNIRLQEKRGGKSDYQHQAS